MKRIYPLAIAAAVMAACDSPTKEREPLATFDMVSLLNLPLPQQIGQVEGSPNCVDSLFARTIDLTTATKAVFTSNEVRNCSGVRSSRNMRREGTYVTTGDTIDFTWELNDPLIFSFDEEAVLHANGRLEFLGRRYTEADPDGNERYVYAVFQRR